MVRDCNDIKFGLPNINNTRVFLRIQSNVCDGVFLWENLKAFSCSLLPQKRSIIDIWMDPMYAFGMHNQRENGKRLYYIKFIHHRTYIPEIFWNTLIATVLSWTLCLFEQFDNICADEHCYNLMYQAMQVCKMS